MAWWSGDRGEEKAKWRVFRVFRSIKARNHTRVSNHQKDRRDKKEYPNIGGSVILAAAFSPSAGRSCYVGYRTDPFPPLATHSETPTHTLSTQHSKHIPQPHAEGICFITGPFVSLSVTHTLCAMEDEKTRTQARMPYRSGMRAGVFKLLHYSQRLMGCSCGPSNMWLSISETMPLLTTLSPSSVPPPTLRSASLSVLSSSSDPLCCRDADSWQRPHSDYFLE